MSDKIDLTWNPEEDVPSKSKPEVKNKVCVEDQHLKSKNKTHKKKKLFYCDICDVITNGNPNHEQGKRHKKMIDDKARRREEGRKGDAESTTETTVKRSKENRGIWFLVGNIS